MRGFWVLLGLLSALALTVPQVNAQMRGGKGSKGEGAGGGRMDGSPPEKAQPPEEAGTQGRLAPEMVAPFAPRLATMEQMKAAGFFATGLKPVYPREAKCLEVSSPFASESRGDGSRRSRQFYSGYHGGIDIPAPEGTPILAAAAVTVVHKGEGIGIGGIGVILQHAPEDTGLPVWTYTEYKHLRELPDLEVGRRVEMGQVIAYAGVTGTTGGYYGPAGSPHLHLTAFFSPGKEFAIARQVVFVPIEGEWMDPLALFRGPPLKSAEVRDLSNDKKVVHFAYKTTDGRLVPEGAKVIWPFACEPR